ncbi:conserved protein of unknown function [Hyphomicrobium sp. 1Nfss2.1]|uniref:hypothetical protein n=1 Tax=Hyphomicrobium sp. 1Nfss2.1 TaxID=3413936 RepID=UPI003C7C8394
MGKLQQQLEEMHIRIAEMASHEETLVKALSDALTRLDEQLLADVQAIASDHEARRVTILGELQGLASSIGMFQVQRSPAAAQIDHEAEVAAYIPSAGDWRQATSNIRDDHEEASHAAHAVQAAGAARPLFPHEKRGVGVSAPLSLVERRRRAAGG